MEYMFQKVKECVECNPFDKNSSELSYLLSDQEEYWEVPLFVYLAISILKEDSMAIDSLLEKLNQLKPDVTIKEDLIRLHDFLTENNLFEGSEEKCEYRIKGVWFRKTIIPASFFEKTKLCSFIFKTPIFEGFSLLIVAWLSYVMTTYPPRYIAGIVGQIKPHDFLVILAVEKVILLFHEFGHVSALMACGARPGDVGISMYYISPVAWSDTSGAWKASRKDRIKVDVGGVYVQLIVTILIFYFVRSFSYLEKYIMICVISVQSALFNLSPLMNSDGQLLAMDYFGTVDPFDTAKELLHIKKRETITMSTTNKALFIAYFVFSTLLMLLFYALLLFVAITSITTVYNDCAYLVQHFEELIGSFRVLDVLRYFQNRFFALIVIIFAGLQVFNMLKMLFCRYKRTN